jgi:hypothetical protein
MSDSALETELRKLLKIYKKGLKTELDTYDQAVQFDPIAMKNTIAKEYRIEDPKILKRMVDYIFNHARKDNRLVEKVRDGKIIFTTRGGTTKQGGVRKANANKYKIFNQWKTEMSGAFHKEFKKEIPTARSSPSKRGDSSNKVKGKNTPGWTGTHRSGRTLSQAMPAEHGFDEAYPRASYPLLEMLYAGQTPEGWSTGAYDYAMGILHKFTSIDALTIEATVKKEIDVKTGFLKGTFEAHLGMGDADQNVKDSTLEKKEFGARGEFVRKMEDAIVDAHLSSPTTMQALDKALTAAILEKGKKVYKDGAKAKVGYKNPKKDKQIRGKKAGKPRLRTSGGQFTSAMNIQAILNAKIKETVADNMGEGGALVYRTGRFASSVGVDKVMQSRQGTLTAYYTYMKAPYQTFERGFAQGSLRRDPRKLISASIREIARETLSHKLHIRTRRV